jgi:hypothetical protein
VKRNAQLVQWEADYPLAGLSMSNDDGILWESRGQASEAYFNEYSFDWEENLQILTDVRAMQEQYGDYVMIAYPIIQNLISDVYFKNPRPLIQDKRGNRDLSRMVTDMTESVHEDADSEEAMRDALFNQSWSGIGVLTAALQQKLYPGADGDLVPEWQRIIVDSLSPWDCRFDPRGRKRDMRDHAYFRHLLTPTLTQVMTWGWLSDEDRARVIAWNRGGMVDHASIGDPFAAQRIDWPSMTDNEDTDPDIIPVPMWVNWDRTKKLVFFQPAGARFTLTPQPWPDEFAQKDIFPFVYMAKNRESKNKRGTTGFIGVPDIRLIRPNLLAVRRYRSLFLAANQHAVFKYLTPTGAFTQAQLDKLMSDKQREVIEWDSTTLDAFPLEMRADTKLFGELLTLVPQPDLKETRHLIGIKLEFDLIAQILGQGSGDRGGMPDTETATDSMIVNQRLNQRLATMRHETGKSYKALTRIIFLILKRRQVLPVQYQMTTAYNEKVWMEFAADELRELDLHFDYAVGSSEPRTREKEFELRERMAAILMPVLQVRGDTRGMMKVARDLVEMLSIRDSEKYFNDAVLDLMKQLAVLYYGIQKGEVNPADRNVLRQQLDLIFAIMNEMLTPEDLAAARAEQQGADAPATAGVGSSPKPLSPGGRSYEAGAAGSASAGAMGGMS